MRWRISRAAGYLQGEQNVLNNLGNIYDERVEYDQAADYYAQSLAMARMRGHQIGQIHALNNLGVVSQKQGHLDQAHDYYEQTLFIARQAQSQHGIAKALGNMGSLARVRQDHSKSRRYYAESLKLARAANLGSTIRYSLLGLADAYLGLGEISRAISLFEEVIELQQNVAQQRMGMEARSRIAKALLIAGEAERALEHTREVAEFLASGGDLTGVDNPLRVHLNMSQVYAANGLHAEARESLQLAYDLLQDQLADLPSEEVRHAVVNTIPWHREVVDLYEGREPGG